MNFFALQEFTAYFKNVNTVLTDSKINIFNISKIEILIVNGMTQFNQQHLKFLDGK